jgi:pilus assembly protein CpaE
MRAGANEFFAWPLQEAPFNEAIARAASRVQSTSGTRAQAYVLMFLGAKGGVGTTTLAVNCAVDLRRLSGRSTIIVDLKPGIGEVGLFLGVRSRYSLLDALDNVHRLDAEFLRELVTRHKSGLDILAGTEQVDRPGAQDAPALEQLLQVLSRFYEFIIIDAGPVTGACAQVAVYGAEAIYVVANPDVPSIRNTQRLVDRICQLGAERERVRVLLNRTSGQHVIAPKQIETALGQAVHQAFSSDYGTVSAALNSGVPLTLSTHSELADQFSRFTRGILNTPEVEEPEERPRRRAHFLGLF